MLSYFPKPYKDELYYSILARYHIHTGGKSRWSTIREMLKKKKVGFELPEGLNYLTSNVKKFSIEYTNEYFIGKHTIIPLLRPFKDPKWFEKVNGANKEISRFPLFREEKHPVNSKNHFYYCPQCVKVQIETNGESYWNRIHQCPGVFVCTKHRIPLIKYPLNLNILRSHEFVLPALQDIRDYREGEEYGFELMNDLLNLAEDIEYIIHKNLDSCSKDDLFEKYETLLKIKEIAYPMLSRQSNLNKLLLNYYQTELLEMLNLSISNNENKSWIGHFNTALSIFSMHPIKHILIMRALSGSVRDFFEKDYTYEPFGKGPWICMNPLADHYLERCVEKVEISVHSLNRMIQGDMICSCGFIYRLRGWEKSPLEVPYFNNRILQKGHVWEERFNELLSQKLTTTEIARRTHLTTPTVRKYLRDRSIDRKAKDEDLKRRRNKKTNYYKKLWLKYREEFPNYKRVELNNIDRATYAWLSKYERDWLEKNSPPALIGKGSTKRKYSRNLDLEYLKKAKEIEGSWELYEKNKRKLVRKSDSLVRELIGLNSVLKKNYELLPLTSKFIESIVESTTDFQKRRVRYLLEKNFKNEKVTLSKITRVAHVDSYIREKGEEGIKIRDYIDSLVSLHNSNLL